MTKISKIQKYSYILFFSAKITIYACTRIKCTLQCQVLLQIRLIAYKTGGPIRIEILSNFAYIKEIPAEYYIRYNFLSLIANIWNILHWFYIPYVHVIIENKNRKLVWFSFNQRLKIYHSNRIHNHIVIH